MKKFLVIALALMLLLAGCAVQNSDETTQTTLPAETTPRGLYVPSSTVEEQTGGAVRLYSLPGDSYSWLSAIGDQLLLASGNDTAELTLLTGEECIQTATASVPSVSAQALYNGFAYYDAQVKQAVFLDPQLQEVDRIQLPDDIQGAPAFSPDGSEIFYCIGQEIRGLEVERKLSRLIKSYACASQTIMGCYFEGKIIACRVEDAQGNVNTLYISTENGQTMRTDNNVTALYTYESNYLALRMDGIVRQQIVGTMDGAAQHLNTPETYITAALELGGAVCYSIDQENALNLSFYDLSSGRKTAAVSLPGVGTPSAFLSDRWTGCFWFLATDPETGGAALFRWDPKSSAVEEDAVYTGTLYTAQSPDEAGLKNCESRASAINKTHGVRIRIWEEAVKYPGSYTLEPEHQTSAINSVLDRLEPVLEEFPKSFLLKSISSRIRICIVRSVDNEVKGVQYWDEDDAFIVLSAGVDVRAEFLKGLGYIVDSHVLGNSSKYDYWDSLNPEGFVYGTADEKYLSGEARAFADEAAMGSATEDRSSILFQAMQPDNAEMFQSEIMQKKLLLVCQAIRDAWNLERKTDVYPWEQYLTQSIAYQK